MSQRNGRGLCTFKLSFVGDRDVTQRITLICTYADVDGGEKKGLCELECVDRGCERRLAPGESKQGAGLDSWCRRPASGVTAGRRQTETEITAMGGLVIPRDVKEKNPILHSPVTTYIQAHWPACVLK